MDCLAKRLIKNFRKNSDQSLLLPTEKKIKVSQIQVTFKNSQRSPAARLTSLNPRKNVYKINSVLNTDLLFPLIKYPRSTKSANRLKTENVSKSRKNSFFNPSPSIFHKNIEKDLSRLIQKVELSANSPLFTKSKRIKRLFKSYLKS